MKPRLLPLALCLLLPCAGCEGDKETRSWYVPPSKSSGEIAVHASGLVGTWRLSGADGAGTWYLHFLADGTWRITEDAAGTREHVYGSYEADESSFRGDLTNPGVGTGSIAGYYNGRSLAIDVAEGWTSPVQHVSYTGSKL